MSEVKLRPLNAEETDRNIGTTREKSNSPPQDRDDKANEDNSTRLSWQTLRKPGAPMEKEANGEPGGEGDPFGE